jgi:hypothetical protein
MPDILLLGLAIIGIIISALVIRLAMDDEVPDGVPIAVVLITIVLWAWFITSKVTLVDPVSTKSYLIETSKDGTYQFVYIEGALYNITRSFGRVYPEGSTVTYITWCKSRSAGVVHTIAENEMKIREAEVKPK